MKYYTIIENRDLFREYIIENKSWLSLICFDDMDKDKIFHLTMKNILVEYPRYVENDKIMSYYFIDCIGEDGYLYRGRMSDRILEKICKFGKRKFLKFYSDYDKKLANNYAISNYISEKYKSNRIEKKGYSLLRYKKFEFVDSINKIKVPFRFYNCRSEIEKPLLIYLHGAGAVGKNNNTQLLEFIFSQVKLDKKDCHVLVPQCYTYTSDNQASIDLYVKSLRLLVEELSKEYLIDKSSIYIIGVSFGGACAWYSLYYNPNFYAGCLPLMGYMYDVYADNFEIDTFKNENIWLGHAENDKIVSIDSSNTFYELSKSKGYNVRYTRYKKYGHNMSKKFLKNEDWKEWLFSQTLSK